MIVGDLFGLVKNGIDSTGMADWAKGLINDGII